MKQTKNRAPLMVAIAALLTLSALPAAAAESEPEKPLAGTTWQLVEFQSMDDATEAVRPEDPSLYTMHLNADGTVTMRLNCNRANGTWTIEPSADPSNGRFEFGPLAMTRALCPPPNLDEMIAAQAQYIRGYLMKDGRLYLSLMADGGIFAWEPAAHDDAEEVEVPPEGALPLSEIVASLEVGSHISIIEVEFEDGAWEIEYVVGGEVHELHVDPMSGEPLDDEAGESDED